MVMRWLTDWMAWQGYRAWRGAARLWSVLDDGGLEIVVRIGDWSEEEEGTCRECGGRGW